MTVYVLLHLRNTSEDKILSDSVDLFDCIRMPLWLNTPLLMHLMLEQTMHGLEQ